LGETQSEHSKGATNSVIEAQLEPFVEVGVDAFKDVVIAYEPVWAIGTGETASPAQAQDVHAFIRSCLMKIDSRAAELTRILYGGSVKPDNAKDLFARNDVDGGLIGGASLNAEDFLQICRSTP
jgi:triosephosphate isomerase